MTMNLLPTISLLASEDPLEHVVDHAQVSIGNVGIITNHMILLLLTTGIMLWAFPRLCRRYQDGIHVPTGTRNFFEALLIYVREDVARPVLAENTDKFIKYLWTLFFFILINNLLGLLPLDVLTGAFLRGLLGTHVQSPTGHWHLRHGIGGTATGNIYVTGALAVISFIVTQAAGIRANGLWNYLKHFTAGAPIYMAPILIPVEIIGMVVKPFALMIRLFANMVAGHVLLAVLIGFVGAALYTESGQIRLGLGLTVGFASIAGATAIMCLELFVAFLQAYLFTFLTALFIGQLVTHEHDEHDEHAHAHHGKDDMSLGQGDMIDHSLPDAARQAGSHMAG